MEEYADEKLTIRALRPDEEKSWALVSLADPLIGTVPDFLVEHHGEEIAENGIQCRDMVQRALTL